MEQEFANKILNLDHKVEKLAGEPRLSAIVRGMMRLFIARPAEAEKMVAHVQFSPGSRPLERFLYFELVSRIYRAHLPEDLTRLWDSYRGMLIAPELGHEEHIYYAFCLLKEIEKQLESQPLSVRIALIERLNQGLSQPLQTLLQSEVFALKLIESPDDKSKAAVYRNLEKLMLQSRGDYFLRKALFVRAIFNFTNAAEFNYLNSIAINWLRDTANSDTEFIYAREVFSAAAFDRRTTAWGRRTITLPTIIFMKL